MKEVKEVKEEGLSEDTVDEKSSGEEHSGEEKSDREIVDEEISEGEAVSGTSVPSDSLIEDNESFVGMITNTVSDKPTWCLAGCAAVLLVIGIIAVSVVLKKRKGDKKSLTANTLGSIPMELRVLSGKVHLGDTTIYLTDSFTIGSQKDCDITMEGNGVEPVHAKIVKQNDQIFIEDLKSKEGVAIGGMLIQERNPLRSGDVISIGDVDFTLVFK